MQQHIDRARGYAPASSAEQAHISIQGVTKSFDGTTVLSSFELELLRGEFVTLLGPSGCGKTTLLRIVAGLLSADHGKIVAAGRDITSVPPHRRNFGMVFQSYALFPHLTVGENVAFGLSVRGVPKSSIRKRVMDALSLVQLEKLEGRSIRALSGGQQQRVSVARALVVEPDLVLFDEPFSALDKKLREQMQIELKDILRRSRATALFVTHDQEEALVLSDRIVVMNGGRAEQVGAPVEVYGRPQTRFVLDFLGKATKVNGQVRGRDGGLTVIDTPYGVLRSTMAAPTGAHVTAAIRPEHIDVGNGPRNEGDFVATAKDTVFLGGRTVISFEARPGDSLLAEVKAQPAGIVSGAAVTLAWPPEETLLFTDTHDG